MSEVIERVMMAFWGKVPKCDLQQGSNGKCVSDDEWQCSCRKIMLENACAAIKAMREPTDEMVNAAYGETAWRHQSAEGAWQAMIDAVLKP